MLISRQTFGVSLPGPLDQASAAWETLLGEVAQAGAGLVRASWSGADDAGARQALAAAAARRLAVVAVCDPATLRPEGAACLAAVAEGPGCHLELSLKEETATDLLNGALISARELPVVLGLGPVHAAAPLPPTEAAGAWDSSQVVAIGVEVTAEDDDPKRIEAPLRAFAAGLRARGLQQPIWPTLLGEPIGTPPAPDAAVDPETRIARLLKHGAHALALGVPRLFLQLPAADAGPTLRAVRTLATWLDGARRITWLALGQYRAEFVDRPNRYLLWADPEIQRLPSSLMGPLTVRDLAGEERRADTSSLRLTASPMLVERR
jgi:hypothetical protein